MPVPPVESTVRMTALRLRIAELSCEEPRMPVVRFGRECRLSALGASVGAATRESSDKKITFRTLNPYTLTN